MNAIADKGLLRKYLTNTNHNAGIAKTITLY